VIPLTHSDSLLVQVLAVFGSKNSASLSLQLGLKPDLVLHPIQVASKALSLLSHFKVLLEALQTSLLVNHPLCHIVIRVPVPLMHISFIGC